MQMLESVATRGPSCRNHKHLNSSRLIYRCAKRSRVTLADTQRAIGRMTFPFDGNRHFGDSHCIATTLLANRAGITLEIAWVEPRDGFFLTKAHRWLKQ